MKPNTLNPSPTSRAAVLVSAFTLLFGSNSAQAQSLSARVANALHEGRVSWLTWSVPSAMEGVACCWNGKGSAGEQACSLSSKSFGMNVSRDRAGIPQMDDTLIVYAHLEKGEVDQVRVFSNSCRVNHDGQTVRDLPGVTAAESVAYLQTLLKGADQGRAARRKSDGALMAIALHDDKSADAALEQAARDGETRPLRESAAFWLGNTRERAGYEALVRLRTSEDTKFRQQLTFAFSQSKVAEASATLIDMARNDPSPRVRSQALFWIAQKAQKKADADVIRAAAAEDPDEEVKKQAVFALSQIPNGEGVPDLIRVARENRNAAVRKQAMFWLGQSRDPRALAFFEKILTQ